MAGERVVTVVGLGPGRWEDLTLEAHDALMRAERVIVRTTRHPTVDALRERRPELEIDAFDALYDAAQSFAELYPRMVERLLDLASDTRGAIIYAVPGHPLIAEESVRLLRLEAPARGIEVRIVGGMSFIEPVCAAIGVDPLSGDMQLLDATLLADIPANALMGVILPNRPALIAQAYNRRLASGVKLALSEMYPEDWEVTVVRWAGLPGTESVDHIPLYELDRAERADHLTTIYVPPLDPLMLLRVPEGLRYITARLRAPNGCPWDREQTHQSLRRYVLEEAYEVAEVLDQWDGSRDVADKLAEELGDLLLQVYLQAEIADEEDFFHLGDVYQQINEKLIRRHPHVFGDVAVRDAEHVVRNWEAIKREERAASGEDVHVESRLRGIPQSAPALYQAYELGRKAAKAGFDWPETAPVLEKLVEEAHELAAATSQDNPREQEAELGDLLFVLTRLADKLGIQPEDALHRANMRFRRRFEAMEAEARQQGRALESLSGDDWLALWQHAKTTTAQ